MLNRTNVRTFGGLFTGRVIKSHVKLHVKSDAQKVNVPGGWLISTIICCVPYSFVRGIEAKERLDMTAGKQEGPN